ncbi:MAG: acetyl-CoA acetyltransferase [Flammeovirgaceae bacterium]|nr:acetyl-CoA acetyltransferase [Flammeovirgaceae bacterium]
MKIVEPFIFDALRTPRGLGRSATVDKPGGSLSSCAPHELIVDLTEALDQRNPGLLKNISSLTLGCVGQVAAQGGHLALVSRLASNIPNHVPVKTLNNYCVSGLTAVNDAATATKTNRDGLHLAGGVESLSSVGFLADQATYYSDPKLSASLNWAPPIMGAELIATIEGFSKQDLDEITLRSHLNAEKAWQNGFYNSSVMPVKDKTGKILLKRDELIRGCLTAEKLAEIPPAFAKQGESGFDQMMLAIHPQLDAIQHLHSIANCPGMADGAALVVIGTEASGNLAGLEPKAKIIATAETAGDPILQLAAGLDAIELLLKQTSLSIHDFDRIEFMEAFAAPTVKFLRRYNPDADKVNTNGGHIAMGHPMGATGAILLTTLVHELKRIDGTLGLVVAQAGGGIGSAMIIERV